MTEFENNCYGITEQEIREQYMQSITANCSCLEMVVMGILSDTQEMVAMNSNPTRSKEYARKQLNIAKFILCEMMDSRVFKETA
jgi:hypothetical protein